MAGRGAAPRSRPWLARSQGAHCSPIAQMGRRRWPVPRSRRDRSRGASRPAPRRARLARRCPRPRALASQRREAPQLPLPLDSARNGLPRLLEMPKRLLKEVQRRVLREILDLIPPHPDAHGFRRGHSAVTNARRAHRQRGRDRLRPRGLLRLRDRRPRVRHLPRRRLPRDSRAPAHGALHERRLARRVEQLPMPERADLIAKRYRLGRRLAAPHLPQGAPTSAAMANLAAFGLDRRLSALGARERRRSTRATPTTSRSRVASGWRRARARSGGWSRRSSRTRGSGSTGAKRRLTTRAGRQVVTGIVVNLHPNLARREYDRLRAVLHDAARTGRRKRTAPASRTSGRTSSAASRGPSRCSPARGARLRAVFTQIAWSSPSAPSV